MTSNASCADKQQPSDRHPVILGLMSGSCILTVFIAAWSLFNLIRCNRYFRLNVRVATGHYLGNDVIMACLTFAALFYPPEDRLSSSPNVNGADQLLYWLSITTWQNLVSLFFLAVLTRYPQIQYDYAILFIVTSWACAAMPTLAAASPYYKQDDTLDCDRPSLWHPVTSPERHLVVSVPTGVLQFALVILTISTMTVRPRKTSEPAPACIYCRVCLSNALVANGVTLTRRLVVIYMIYCLPHTVVVMTISIQKSYSHRPFLGPGGRYEWLLYLLEGAGGWVDGVAVLYSQWKLMGRRIMPWEMESTLDASDGGDHPGKAGDQNVVNLLSTPPFASHYRASVAALRGITCSCDHCKEHAAARDESARLKSLVSSTSSRERKRRPSRPC